MKNENDLRVLRTRKNIVDSFLALLAVKPLEEISVTEICEKAVCSRNTFYLHFPYKEALYDHVVNEFVNKVKDVFDPADILPENDYEEFADHYLRRVGGAVLSQKEELRPILVANQADSFFSKLVDELLEKFLSNIEILVPGGSKNGPYRLMCWYSVSAIVGFLKGCLYDVDIPTDEALDVLCAMHAPPFAVATKYLRECK